MTIPVLHEDESVLVVDKPSGVSTIPDRTGEPSVLEILSRERGEKLFVVHRLDRDVSGVLLFARTADAHRTLNAQFEKREITKRYLALVHGKVNPENGRIEQPIREFGSGRMGIDAVRGKPSRTDFEVIERFRRMTLLAVSPYTGRRHQIRVHLWSIGHPVVGDRWYGDIPAQKAFPRLMLHASTLSLPRPVGGPLTLSAALPPAFRSVLESARAES